jgi:hypothetical protein
MNRNNTRKKIVWQNARTPTIFMGVKRLPLSAR